MKRVLTIAVGMAMLIGLLQPASAGPSPGGLSTDNVEWVTMVPFDQTTSTGVNIQGKWMYLTSWKNLSIYDISDPEAPALVGYSPWGSPATGAQAGTSPFQFENENVATNGKILLMSESLPRSILHVWDVEDKTNPVEIAQLAGAGDHTQTCILHCRWAYGSDGTIVDLKDPAKPEIAKVNWHEATGLQGGGHDVEEFKNGFLLTSPISAPFQYLDVRDPLKPKVLATGANPNPSGFLFHSGHWPNQGRDKFVLMQGEKNVRNRCDGNTGPFMTFDASKWKSTHTFKQIDEYHFQNGTFVDGSPPANGLGCSAHWFDEHPTFDDGGLVALGAYEHGTRFFDVSSKGKIKEVGYFMPFGGSTSAAYWVTKDLVYSVDYTRGIDILRYTGKL